MYYKKKNWHLWFTSANSLVAGIFFTKPEEAHQFRRLGRFI